MEWRLEFLLTAGRAVVDALLHRGVRRIAVTADTSTSSLHVVRHLIANQLKVSYLYVLVS
jgi:hypothetical protein